MPLDAEAKDNIISAIQAVKTAIRGVDLALDPFISTGLTLTDDRLQAVTNALTELSEAQRVYDGALELAGLNPPHRG